MTMVYWILVETLIKVIYIDQLHVRRCHLSKETGEEQEADNFLGAQSG